MARRALTALLLAALPALGQAPPPEDVRLVAAELAALGTAATPWFEVDLARLRVEERAAEECLPALAREQELLASTARREARAALLAAWGRADADESSQAAARRLAAALPARWLEAEGALLLVRGARGAEGLPTRGLLLAHELARAWQDQRLGLGARREAARTSTEAAWLLQALLEGQAGAIGLALSRARIRRSLQDVDPLGLSSEAEQRLLGPLHAQALEQGRAHAVRAFQRGGWAGLRDVLEAPPASSEQLLHPEKLGRDRPREVELPAWPAAAGPARELDQDTLGELPLLALLLELGLPAGEAARAATGWDGDRLAVYRSQDGGRAVVWRSVWDREDDARQAAQTLERRWAGRWDRRGRVLDAVWAEGKVPREAALIEALRRLPAPDRPEEEDAASAAAIEAELARREVLGTARWRLPEHELSLPIPPGWGLGSYQGTPYLAAPLEGDFADNINVRPGTWRVGDAASLLRQLREELEGGGGKVLEATPLQGPNGGPAVRAEYVMRWEGRPLHFVVLVLTRGPTTTVITATSTEERWQARRPLFDAILGDAQSLTR